MSLIVKFCCSVLNSFVCCQIQMVFINEITNYRWGSSYFVLDCSRIITIPVYYSCFYFWHIYKIGKNWLAPLFSFNLTLICCTKIIQEISSIHISITILILNVYNNNLFMFYRMSFNIRIPTKFMSIGCQ